MRQIPLKVKDILKMASCFFSTFTTVFVALIAIFLVVIKLLGWNLFSIDSSSMSPHYPIDTLIVAQKTNPERIQPGDVITFVLNKEGTLATHRVISVNSADKTFTTKGDANDSVDAAPVEWENMIGKVVLGIPWLGKPLRIFTAEENRLFIMLGLAILFVFSLVWDITTKAKAHPKDSYQ